MLHPSWVSRSTFARQPKLTRLFDRIKKKLLTWSKQPSKVYFGTCVHVDVEVITAGDLFLAWSTRLGSCGNCAAVPASCSSTKAHRANKCLSRIPTWQLRRCVVRVAIVRSLEMFSFKNTSDVLSNGYQYLAVYHHISRISNMHIISYYYDIVHILRSSYITEFCMQMSAASWRSNFALQPPCRMPPSKKRPGIGMWPAAACRQAMKPRPSPSPLCPKFIAKKYFAVFCCILAWCLCLEDTTQPQLTHWHLEGQWQSCELLSYLLPSRTLEKDWCPIANQQTNHSRLRSQPTKMLREIETPAMRIWKAMSKKHKYHCSKLTPSPVVVRCAQSGGT